MPLQLFRHATGPPARPLLLRVPHGDAADLRTLAQAVLPGPEPLLENHRCLAHAQRTQTRRSRTAPRARRYALRRALFNLLAVRPFRERLEVGPRPGVRGVQAQGDVLDVEIALGDRDGWSKRGERGGGGGRDGEPDGAMDDGVDGGPIGTERGARDGPAAASLPIWTRLAMS